MKSFHRKEAVVLRILKKIYPYMAIPLVMLYISIIFKLKNLMKYGSYDSNFHSTLPFFIDNFAFAHIVTLPLISIVFGILLELLCRKTVSLRVKINGPFLIIGLIFAFFYAIYYTPIADFFVQLNFLPIFLITDAPAYYLIPTLVGFYLSKGLLAPKESEND